VTQAPVASWTASPIKSLVTTNSANNAQSIRDDLDEKNAIASTTD